MRTVTSSDIVDVQLEVPPPPQAAASFMEECHSDATESLIIEVAGIRRLIESIVSIFSDLGISSIQNAQC